MPTVKLSRRALLASGLAAAALPSVLAAQSSTREVEGGIGGTGIVGILTDFGSLIVAGTYMQTDQRTAFTDGFGPIRQSDLRVGDSLTVEAAGDGPDMVARRVHVTHPVVGVVSAISQDNRQLTVNGVTVEAPSAALRIGQGDRVAVSGLWRDGRVIASRIAKTGQPLDLVSGDVLRGFGAVRVGSTAVRGSGVSGLSSGAFATVIGRFDPSRGRLQAEQVIRERFVGAAGPLERLSIEGFLEPTDIAPGFRVAGLGHSFERNLRLEPYAQSRVLFQGPYTGKFAADRAYVLPEAFGARRSALRRISQS